eukprot:1159493-Pelagomonas_calceolata.AAC.2
MPTLQCTVFPSPLRAWTKLLPHDLVLHTVSSPIPHNLPLHSIPRKLPLHSIPHDLPHNFMLHTVSSPIPHDLPLLPRNLVLHTVSSPNTPEVSTLVSSSGLSLVMPTSCSNEGASHMDSGDKGTHPAYPVHWDTERRGHNLITSPCKASAAHLDAEDSGHPLHDSNNKTFKTMLGVEECRLQKTSVAPRLTRLRWRR